MDSEGKKGKVDGLRGKKKKGNSPKHKHVTYGTREKSVLKKKKEPLKVIIEKRKKGALMNFH